MPSAFGSALLLLAPLSALEAQPARLGLEVFLGAPANLKTPLEIRQAGHPTLDFQASYRSEPFRGPVFWAVRLTREAASRDWSLELVHDKLFLDNPPADVQNFEITHGFNFITLQRSWPAWSEFRVRLGLGGALAHPENIVRGQPLSEHKGIFGSGYRLTGPAAIVALGRRFPVWRRLSLALETRASVTPVSVPVAGGEARLTHVAFYLMGGAAFFPR
jgi:hypothetical protein